MTYTTISGWDDKKKPKSGVLRCSVIYSESDEMVKLISIFPLNFFFSHSQLIKKKKNEMSFNEYDLTTFTKRILNFGPAALYHIEYNTWTRI
jgi:hypothetical protein